VRQLCFVKDGIHKIRVQETRDGQTLNLMDLGEQLYTGYKAPLPVEPVKAAGASSGASPAAGASGNTSRALKAPGSSAARRKEATPETGAAWDAKLMARVREELAAKHLPRFLLGSMKQEVGIVSLDDKGGMRISNAAIEVPYKWASLTVEDKANLSRSLVRKGQPEDLCLAAFYLLILGADEKADELLQEVPDQKDVEDVRAAFK
jgi:hypothetical protein